MAESTGVGKTELTTKPILRHQFIFLLATNSKSSYTGVVDIIPRISNLFLFSNSDICSKEELRVMEDSEKETKGDVEKTLIIYKKTFDPIITRKRDGNYQIRINYVTSSNKCAQLIPCPVVFGSYEKAVEYGESFRNILENRKRGAKSINSVTLALLEQSKLEVKAKRQKMDSSPRPLLANRFSGPEAREYDAILRNGTHPSMSRAEFLQMKCQASISRFQRLAMRNLRKYRGLTMEKENSIYRKKSLRNRYDYLITLRADLISFVKFNEGIRKELEISIANLSVSRYCLEPDVITDNVYRLNVMDANKHVFDAADDDPTCSLSAGQQKRVFKQCRVVHEYLIQKIERQNKQIEVIEVNICRITFVNDSITEDACEKCMTELTEIKTTLSAQGMAYKAKVNLKRVNIIVSEALVLEYYNEFKCLQFKGFIKLDVGHHQRIDFLETYNLSSRFKFFMKCEKSLSVDKCKEYLDKAIIDSANSSQNLLERLQYHSLHFPLARVTVWRWMITHGAKFNKFKQSYYTDNHDSAENVKYRNECYLLRLRDLSKRMPVWIHHDDATREPYHVDMFDDSSFINMRKKVMNATGFPGQFFYPVEQIDYGLNDSIRFKSVTKCQAIPAHTPTMCKCNRVLIHIGQDEAAFKQNSISCLGWEFDGKSKLNKKTEGKGEMVSRFQDCMRSHGFLITPIELDRVNEWRNEKYSGAKPRLTESPGSRYLQYGNENWWNYEKFAVQVEDLMDAFDCLYPNCQMLLEVDHSSGHTKKKPDGLSTDNMNMKWGGSKPKLRDSILSDGDVHVPASSTNGYITVGSYSYKLFVAGDTQLMYFVEGDLPPFYDQNVPKYDSMAPDGKVIPGYIGKPKGILQVLFERGLYKEKMRSSLDNKEIERRLAEGRPLIDPTLDAPLVLSNCPDFSSEVSALCELVQSRGHILILSPKCHPELAGCGIEYSWGRIKMNYRRNVNDCVAKNLHDNIEKASEIVDLPSVWKFERRTRDYRRMYEDLAKKTADGSIKQEDISFQLLESMRKVYKTHRNIEEIDRDFIRSVNNHN